MISLTLRCGTLDVLHNRRYPDSIETHILDIIQFADNTFPVSTAVDAVAGIAAGRRAISDSEPVGDELGWRIEVRM